MRRRQILLLRAAALLVLFLTMSMIALMEPAMIGLMEPLAGGRFGPRPKVVYLRFGFRSILHAGVPFFFGASIWSYIQESPV